jgi:hypothetical protein
LRAAIVLLIVVAGSGFLNPPIPPPGVEAQRSAAVGASRLAGPARPRDHQLVLFGFCGQPGGESALGFCLPWRRWLAIPTVAGWGQALVGQMLALSRSSAVPAALGGLVSLWCGCSPR